MSYRNVLVAVAQAPDSIRLLEKAVAIARPYSGTISLITLCNEPDLCSSFAGPMLGDLRRLLHEEAELFLQQLIDQVDYPIEKTLICSGELGDCIVYACQQNPVDLVICGNHGEKLLKRMLNSATLVIDKTRTDVLIVPL
ncbi:universal stress protein UspC [Enterobacillus tribolii]|uniref:Universal stress protein n=1 Tax=Enterobacillus tribolii TaxID=1487935 RepID=A0A370R4V3_9GAMM|nr:universal stress protein UspC [Enterobacillus tribolii]MBW7983401.1 universal stress protein UspC [Enterobacillus tribolii]RDK97461.1 universal stress protein C [Enterobacillus tribolii]